MTRLKVLPKSCDTCPYAKSTPSGVWAKSEYLKLPEFDQSTGLSVPALGVFLCHNAGTDKSTNDTVCRGWLSVHRDSVAVRLGLALGGLAVEDLDALPEFPEPGLYKSGAEACRAGLRGVQRPGKKANAAMTKIQRLRQNREREQRRAKARKAKNG